MDNNTLYNLIDSLPGLKFTGGVSTDVISNAEAELGISFAPDFISYLKRYGQIEANGLEIMGISNKISTSVVNATIQLRKFGNLPKMFYVIEDLEIDGIVYVQDFSGRVYQYVIGGTPRLYALSLIEYLKMASKL